MEFSAEANDQWRDLGRALTRALSAQKHRTLILIDELPVFVLALVRRDPTGERARSFLNWFRTLRQEDEPGLHVRYILAGSIGLDTVAARLGLGDTINDLQIQGLGAFPADVADRFLKALADSYNLPLDRDLRAILLARIGWPIPFFLQLAFARLRALCRDRGCPPTQALGVEALEALMTTTHRAQFDWWRQRLHDELGKPEAGWALTLLEATARDPMGLSAGSLRQELGRQVPDVDARDAALSYLLRVLESDGYLIREDGRHRFRSPLLREYWIRHVAR